MRRKETLEHVWLRFSKTVFVLKNKENTVKTFGSCYSIVELETSCKKKTCIHVELRNIIFFPIWFRIVLYINKWFVIFPSIISKYMVSKPRAKKKNGQFAVFSFRKSPRGS